MENDDLIVVCGFLTFHGWIVMSTWIGYMGGQFSRMPMDPQNYFMLQFSTIHFGGLIILTTLSWIFRTFESFFERNPYAGCTHCAWTAQGFWVAGAFRTSPVEKSELSHATPVDVGFLSQWIGSRENRSGNHGFYQHFQFWYTQCIIWLVVSPPSKQMSNMGKSKDGEYPQTTRRVGHGPSKKIFSCDWQEVNHAFRSFISCFYVVHEGKFYCDVEFSLGFTV